MRNTFLYQVWLHNKKLCYLLTAFASLTIFFNVLGDQVTPFFVWGMYSEKEKTVLQYEILKTTINDSTVVDPYDYLTTDTRFYLYTPLAYYKKIKDNNNEDPTLSFLKSKLGPKHHETIDKMMQRLKINTDMQRKQFLYWYVGYLQQVTNRPVNSLRIDVVSAHYTDKNLVVDSIHPFATWERP